MPKLRKPNRLPQEQSNILYHFRIPPDLVDQVRLIQKQTNDAGVPITLQDVVVELLRVGLSADFSSAQALAMRQAAFRQANNQIWQAYRNWSKNQFKLITEQLNIKDEE